jgi:hypothetical protein
MEAQQRVENGKGAIAGAQQGLGLADGTEHLPFVGAGARRAAVCRHLTCHHGKRQQPPPKGRRRDMRVHNFSAFQRGKRNLLTS